MALVPADLRIDARWLLPMTLHGSILEHHSLLVRNGRILDVLPTAEARERYRADAVLERLAHLLMPGLIDANAQASLSLFRVAHAANESVASAAFAQDSVTRAIAEMLMSGTTCFVDRGLFPDAAARVAQQQGMRAVIGMPLADAASAWARNPAEYLSRALEMRDEYRSHSLISTAFSPLRADGLSDAVFTKLATLADELDATIAMQLQQPERLWQLGLLTPAFNAIHLTQVAAPDIELAARSGMSVTLCTQAALRTGATLPPYAALQAAGVRVALGSAGGEGFCYGLWDEVRCAVLGGADGWNALAMATRGGAAALNLEAELGTLQTGKWADLCCLDLSAPAAYSARIGLDYLAANGGRDLVSDVWVAGRQLLSAGVLTRLDWAAAAARADCWSARA